MTRKYTAADFANARFAEHPETGTLAVQRNTGLCEWTTFDDDGYTGWVSTATMLEVGGWVPVPTKPSIKKSVKEHYLDGEDWEFKWGFNTALALLDAEVVPDPEPTNTERLAELVEEMATAARVDLNPMLFAKHLDNHGVTAPNVKDN